MARAKKKQKKPRGAKRAPRASFRKPAAKPKKQRAKPKKLAEGLEQLGVVTAPSGKLSVFDIGLIGYLPRPALEPAIVTIDVATRSTALPVVGRRVGKGRFADCWDHVAVVLGAGEVAMSKKLGEAGVDFARLVYIDHGALDHWQHEDSLDGLADFMFWGRDAGLLAKAMHAPRTKEGYGWRNLAVAAAEAKADQAARLKAKDRWLLATDFRPHSHHFHALAAARKSPHGAGTIEVGGTKVCLFFTSWGDGVFPVYLDLDHDDRPVQLRVQLDTADSMTATS